MAGWTQLTPSAGDPGTGNAYLYEDSGALKYRGTSGTASTIVNADSTLNGGGGIAGWSGFSKLATGYYYQHAIGPTGTVTATLGELRYTAFYVPNDVTVIRIGARVGTSAGGALFRMGIYSANSDDFPGSLVIDAGTIDCSSTGSKAITISQSLSAGLYWLAGVGQGSAAPGIRGFNTAGYADYAPGGTISGGIDANPPKGFMQTGITGSLPSTATLSTLPNNVFAVHIGV